MLQTVKLLEVGFLGTAPSLYWAGGSGPGGHPERRVTVMVGHISDVTAPAEPGFAATSPAELALCLSRCRADRCATSEIPGGRAVLCLAISLKRLILTF